MTKKAYAVDLITFYAPASWGVSNEAELRALGAGDPVPIWTRIFDSLAEAGMSAFEMTFPPADWTSAVRAFGSAEGFQQEIAARGLGLRSLFCSVDWSADDKAIIGSAVEQLDFARDAGAPTIIVGPPFRKTLGARPSNFADFDQAKRVADLMNVIGFEGYARGVEVALHAEAQTIFYTPRDIDLLLLLTDPDYVHFCPDAAHITLGGGNAVEVAAKYRDRIVISHWKDGVFGMPRSIPVDENVFTEHEKYMRPIGTGDVDWAGWARVIEGTPGSDTVLLELDMIPDPVSELIRARDFVDGLFRSLSPAGAAE